MSFNFSYIILDMLKLSYNDGQILTGHFSSKDVCPPREQVKFRRFEEERLRFNDETQPLLSSCRNK